MLNNLFKLYLRNRTKTPLEDFTTEAFAGILNYDSKIKNDFVSTFLQLPEKDYRIKTQVKYDLDNDTNCIIDFVLESEDIICFIENKVNSKEGDRQLERYGKVLDIYFNDGYKTYLRYCTKYFDDKPLDVHHFNQFRWFQIARFLKYYSENALVRDFLEFLKRKNMSQELTITTKDLFAIENLVETIEIIKGYLERVKPLFLKTFKSQIKLSDGCTTTQLLLHKRMIYYYKDIVGQSGWSEIKYGFQTSSSNIYVGIWVDKANSDYPIFKNHFENNDYGFKIVNLDRGIAIELKASLQNFINDENADSQISDWFKDSFSKFSSLIESINNASWKIGIS